MAEHAAVDSPCVCGHVMSKHKDMFLSNPVEHGVLGYCTGCYNVIGEDSCFHEFKMDNLKYLELMVEQKEAEC